jgi:hypothetical protein
LPQGLDDGGGRVSWNGFLESGRVAQGVFKGSHPEKRVAAGNMNMADPFPQGLKPDSFRGLSGTTKVVPFQTDFTTNWWTAVNFQG